MIKCNWKPDKPLLMDFETQSACDIALGGRAYAMHPTTRITCAAFLMPDEGKGLLWVPEYIPFDFDSRIKPRSPHQWELTRMPPAINPETTLIAHNALGFDAHVWEHHIKEPVTWYDTIMCARAAGLPGSLELLGKVLCARGKSIEGQVNRVLSKVSMSGGRPQYPVATKAAWEMLFRYCCEDVDLLKVVYEKTKAFAIPHRMDVHHKINDRGIPIDLPFAARLVTLQDEADRLNMIKVTDLTKGNLDAVDVTSPARVKTWLRSLGIEVESLEKKAIEQMLAHPDRFFEDSDSAPADVQMAVEALRIRQEICRVGKGKAIAMLRETGPDGRARDQTIQNGAHTGRSTGRGIQPHNFPRGIDKFDGDALCLRWAALTLAEVEEAATAYKKTPGDVIGTLLRSAICAPPGRALAVADYGAIEARGAAWIAQEHRLLAAFGDPYRDAYLDFGESLFGERFDKKDPRRFLCKTAVLGSMYGMSGPKFEATLALQGYSCQDLGVDGRTVIAAYRRTFPHIPAVWGFLQKALHRATLEKTPQRAGRCDFEMHDRDMHVVLPSGRHLVYREARIEPMVPGYCAALNLPPRPVDTFTFDHPHQYRGFLYGGRILENIVQAMCSDLLFDALAEIESAGLRPILHVHDEAVCEVDWDTRAAALDDLCRIMSTPPPWCPDFPILVEGHVNARYAKAPTKSSLQSTYLNGRKV